MLCHTALGPDSRVIKQVRSMSERGWDVVVLATADATNGLDLRGARVRVVKPDPTLSRQIHLGRTGRFRSPLAVGSGVRRAKQLLMLQESRLDDLRYRVDAVELRRPPGGSIRIAGLRGRALLKKGRIRWSRMRLDRTTRLHESRRAMDGPLDRATQRLWLSLMGNRAWRRLWPGVYAQERAYGPVIDALKPDIIQANDFMMLAVGARAKLRAERAGRAPKLVWDAREYLPGMSPWSAHPRWKAAHVGLEREFAPYADAVVTVSDPLADFLVRDYELTERPAVVLNAPHVLDPPIVCETDVRTESGIGPDVPLVVYSGAAAPQRGLEVMVDALPHLPGVHTAFVVLPPHRDEVAPYVTEIIERARALEVSDRVHVLNYVGVDEVVSFLSTADVGVFPGLPFLNHTISLITKFMEYSHARLPIVVSNLRYMAETVRATGQGEVFEPEDVASYVAAVKKILASPDAYVAAYDDAERMRSWEWEAQAVVMEDLYSRLHPSAGGDQQ